MSSCCEPAKSPVREKRVLLAVNTLESKVSRAEIRVKAVEDALNQVMRNEPATACNESEDPEQPSCELEGQLLSQAERIEGVALRMESVIDRLEI